MIKEEWKQIDGFEYYYISNLGRVKSTRRWSGTKFYERKHLVSLYTNKKNGYVYVSISKNNRVDNLEWCDGSYNIKDMYKRKGKYDNDNIIIEKYKDLKSCNKVAKIFNTTGENIRQVLIRNNIERK